MTVAQVRNDELVALLRADLLPLADRNVCLSLVDMDGRLFTTQVDHGFSQVRWNTAPSVFAISGAEITIGATGLYWVCLNATIANNTGAGGNVAVLWLEYDGGAGYAPIAGAGVKVYVPAGAGWQNSGARHAVLRFNAGDKIKARVARSQGSDTLAVEGQGGSSLEIVRLFGLE